MAWMRWGDRDAPGEVRCGCALVVRAVVLGCDFAGAAMRERATEASEIFTKTS